MNNNKNNGIISDEEIKHRISEYRLLDDVFLTAYFKENISGVEFILRIILNIKDLTVESLKVQNEYKNIQGRSVQLDITAKDSNGKLYDIEIQRDDDGAIPKRARYHSAMLDSNELKQGHYFDELPETYVIFIIENDIFKMQLPIYQIDRYINGRNNEKILFNDNAHIIYVNGEIQDETELGRLMHDFFCKKADDMYYNELAERMRFLKEDEGGSAIMASTIQELIKEGEIIGADKKSKQTAITMLKVGKCSLDEISLYTDLSIDEIKILQKSILQSN